MQQGNSLQRKVASTLVVAWEEATEIHGIVEDYDLIEKHRELVEALLAPLLPQAFSQQVIAAAAAPYGKQMIYTTEMFDKIVGSKMAEDAEAQVAGGVEQMVYRKLLHAYLMIFKEFYAVDLPVERAMLFEVTEPETGYERYYKSEIVTDFIEVVVRSEPKPLSDEDMQDILENAHDLSVWMKHLPFEHFEFRGLAIMGVMDISQQEILSRLKHDLLEKTALVKPQKLKAVEHRLRSLFSIPDLQLGVSAFNPASGEFTKQGEIVGSMLASYNIKTCINKDDMQQQMVERNEPYIISNLEGLAKQGGVWEELYEKKGLRSILLAPLRDDDSFIGVMEVGSKTPGALSAGLLIQIRDILPLFSIALKRNAEERESQVDTIIKKQYTSIHPAVEWRFVEAAKRYLVQKETGESAEAEEIVFKDVSPLYAASDIRNSSTHRNEAIQWDLIEQLQLSKEVVEIMLEYQNMPVLKQLKYKIDKHIQHIQAGLFSGDEMEVINFMRNEVESCLNHLKVQLPEEAESAFSLYENSIDPDLGILYKRRKAFEESLTAINEAVSEYIEKAEEEAQQLYPHYFEKYKTDGVEYNIYIGQSISPNKPYSSLYLKNLRLWQLTTTANVARLADKMKPSLKVPLDTTHLILVHSGLLSVKFRMDERQFDVDGAYNIRYEIVKKRIDKAYIKGTEERLTQPAKIAIVYSQDKDAREYREYIEYLQYQGLLEAHVEDLELEALQGVQGLRALRVAVNLAGSPESSISDWVKPATTLNGHAVRVEAERMGG